MCIRDRRHSALDIHKNGTAPLEHIFNQMRCAGLDRLCLLPEDYTTELGRPVVTNEEVKALVDLAPDKFIGFASVDPFLPDAAQRLEHAFGDLGPVSYTHLSIMAILPARSAMDMICG